jgi:probable F420-dependent oxidoreductase
MNGRRQGNDFEGGPPVNIGVFQVAQVDPAIVARHAEELGFESYWVGDHTTVPVEYSVPYPGFHEGKGEPGYLWQLFDPLIALTRASATTKKIGLGMGVCLVAERNPILLAKQVATLDQLSGGRVLFGIGGGWNPEECTVLGGDFAHRWAQVKEAVAVIRALWTEHAPEHHGRYFDFAPIRVYPKPAQKPHPPILHGAIMNPRSTKRVVEWGDGWMPVVTSVEEFAAGVEDIRARAREAGRDPAGFDFTVFGLSGQWLKPDEVRAFERAGATRVILWLDAMERDPILREMDALAREHGISR